MKIYSQNCLIDGRFVPAIVEVEAGVITKIQTSDVSENSRNDLNFKSGFLIPGLIDLQLNGVAGVDFSSCTLEQANQALASLPASGTTSVCPTVITSPIEQISSQVDLFSSLTPKAKSARNLGVHLEGPVINPSRRGAHQKELLLSAKQFLDSNVDLRKIRIITLAPELENVKQLIDAANLAGAVVSLGHTDATSAQTHSAVADGARMVTHLFNGMRSVHQREPGIVITTLLNDTLNFGIIVDGEHVDFELVKLAQTLASTRMIVVSDASSALLSKPGSEFELGGSKVVVDSTGVARRTDGTLASSGMTQLEAIEKAVANGLSREALLTSATQIPADFLNEPKLGRIQLGATADLIHYESGLSPEIDFVMVGGDQCQF